ncbi:S9 family peptidase [Flavobacterium daejeonense]|uniref:S9 family peptidase n=1 Tax=Flavobacterium daejeonense TaxID=350893 RepID=UPI00047EEE50|nr:DPP IV N-terminal domain-containing protein [Flavobacterium daejeonense]
MNRFVLFLFFFVNIVLGQTTLDLNRINWLPESHSFWVNEKGDLVIYNADELDKKTVFLTKEQLKIIGFEGGIESVVWNTKQDKILIYTHSQRVWRANTKGDYWFVDLTTKQGRQIGQGLDKASLMFAKFSSDGNIIAYVSKHNIYTEDVTSGVITQLTFDGNEKIINGTFDWVYEEELMARDGFRWSPDGTQIAFWRVDTTETKFHLMINNTDALYPFTVPVEYPKAGEKPSAVKLGVITLADKKVNWLKIPGEADNNYLPRIQWLDSKELMAVQLNRKQNQVTLYRCNSNSGVANKVYQESSNTWIDVFDSSAGKYDSFPCTVVDKGKAFLWSSDADGWMHIYKISVDGKKKDLITKVNFDTYFLTYNKNTKCIYHLSSPSDATQRYLYETNLNTKKTKRVTPSVFEGTNTYSFSSDAAYAVHTNSNINRNWNSRLLSLVEHKKIFPKEADVFVTPTRNFSLKKFKVKTIDGVELDGIMAKPLDFDATKKYPLFFYVYGEPAASVANDVPYFNGFISNLIPQGYIGIALDNRGTPVMKGTEWRKSIYKNIGIINARDQAMAAKEILKWNFIDTTRVAVHGWSGGGTVTLNLLFQYPEIYKTGIAVAAVTDQHFYDNIYTERYMSLPSESEEAYAKASPVNHAKNLKGNLLYIHGTGDDNVHYKNAEVLINELVKYDKMFDLMIYPNRSHSINEGMGTRKHLNDTFMKYIIENCPPGAK